MPRVMQAYSSIVDPKLMYAALQALGTKLNPGARGEFRVNVLDRDVEIQAASGHARFAQDNFENTYDACFEDACIYKLWS